MKYIFFGALALMLNMAAATPAKKTVNLDLTGYCKVTSGTSILYVYYGDGKTTVYRWSLSNGDVTINTFAGDDWGRALCNQTNK